MDKSGVLEISSDKMDELVMLVSDLVNLRSKFDSDTIDKTTLNSQLSLITSNMHEYVMTLRMDSVEDLLDSLSDITVLNKSGVDLKMDKDKLPLLKTLVDKLVDSMKESLPSDFTEKDITLELQNKGNIVKFMFKSPTSMDNMESIKTYFDYSFDESDVYTITPKLKDNELVVDLSMKVSLAVMKSLLFTINDSSYGVPLETVQEVFEVNVDEFKVVNQAKTLLHRGNLIPLIDLEEEFKLESSGLELRNIVVLDLPGGTTLGVVSDFVQGQKELVVQGTGDYSKNNQKLLGSSLLGSGEITLILDPLSFV